VFARLRGAGGDGGVEALFTASDSAVFGMQAKYFFQLGSSELSQMKGSLAAARQNYPRLREYSIYLPFDPTGRVAGGKRGKSETERFKDWKMDVESKAELAGSPLTIHLIYRFEVERQLLASDPNGGWRRYWFGTPTLTKETIRSCLNQATAFAGPRYTATLDVITPAHETLDVFGGTKNIEPWVNEAFRPSVEKFLSVTRDARADKAFKVLEIGDGELAEKSSRDYTRSH